MFLVILAVAAAVVAVGLALALQVFRRTGTVDADAIAELKG
jgi:NADH:ubiquinone oxidoreductase subunit K